MILFKMKILINDKFKLFSKKELEKSIINVFEVKNNVLIIFHESYPFVNDSMSSLNTHNYIISKYDIDKKNRKYKLFNYYIN